MNPTENTPETSRDKSSWKTGYTIAIILGISYIILLGLFTWLLNYAL